MSTYTLPIITTNRRPRVPTSTHHNGVMYELRSSDEFILFESYSPGFLELWRVQIICCMVAWKAYFFPPLDTMKIRLSPCHDVCRFFLMHLINKPDTEYTGQETYVWNMYQQRCWDFFPVGDCFRKQYEEELGGGGGVW